MRESAKAFRAGAGVLHAQLCRTGHRRYRRRHRTAETFAVGRSARPDCRRPVPYGEGVGRGRCAFCGTGWRWPPKHESAGFRMLSKRIIACSRPRRPRRQGHQLRRLRSGRRSCRAGAASITMKGSDELVILDVTATLERRRRAPPRRFAAVARELFIPADGRRRNPYRRNGAGGRRGRRRQVRPEHRGSVEPRADHDAGQTRYGSQANHRGESMPSARCLRAVWMHFAVYARSGQTAADRDAARRVGAGGRGARRR